MGSVAVVGIPAEVDALANTGHEVTLVPVGTAPPLDVRVSPGNLATSYRLYRFLERQKYDAIVFPAFGGHGYCSARAKQLGLAFTNTRILVHWNGPLQWRAERELRAYLDPDDIRQAVCERLQIELADGLVAGPEEADWIRQQGWELDGDVYADDPRGWAEALTAAPRAPRTGAEPAVTVVVPHFERAHLLPQCLEGLARQTYPRLEVVVVDDGSPSEAVREGLVRIDARSWPWPLRVLRQAHGGVDSARNAGWRAAETDLVLFIDDDDVPFDELVTTLVRARVAAGVDVVAAGIRTFSDVTDRPRARAGDVIGIFLARPYEYGLLANQYGGPVCLWPKDLLERLGGFRHSAHVQEDGEILARATLAGASISAVPRPLYWNRLNPKGRYWEGQFTMRAAWPAIVARLHAERMPAGYKLAPLLAGGAYSEIDRLRGAQPAAGRTAERLHSALRRVRRAAGRLRSTF